MAAGSRAKRRGPLPKGKGSVAALDQAVAAASAAVAVMHGEEALATCCVPGSDPWLCACLLGLSVTAHS